ncbi:MAG: hypothetical protein ABJ382_18210 [Ilumatobacter sp.]
MNRGKRMTCLERDDCSMLVIAPSLASIEQYGLSQYEDDGFHLGD